MGFFGVHFLRAGVPALSGGATGFVSVGSGWMGAVDDDSAGVGEGVDFGCHFLRSGVGAAVCVAVRIGERTGAVSEIGEATGLCSEDGVGDLGCHFFRSTDGIAD